jgi:hypothetical protein
MTDQFKFTGLPAGSIAIEKHETELIYSLILGKMTMDNHYMVCTSV